MTPATCVAPGHDLSDAALAEQAGAGDQSAFEALDRRHRSTLLRHCNQILRNSHDAEEAVQGVLLKAYGALSRGQRPASLLPWLMVIARNECFDIIRARRRTEELPLDIESSAIRPDELVLRREDARVLHADLKELPEAQRAALVLRSIGDLPHGEIARVLGGTAADARTLCHEARVSLAECQEGRNLECSAVLERIESGDGRALRARRIRAHLRACGGCRDTADRTRAPRRSGLGALFPLPWLASLRGLFFGGTTTGAIGGIGSAALVGIPVAAAVAALAVGVSVHSGGSARADAPSPSVTAPAIRPASPSASTRMITPPTPPEAVAGTSAPTPAASRPDPGTGASATTQPVLVPAPKIGLQTPEVRVPVVGVTVPGVKLPPVPTISVQTPEVRVPVVGITVPSVQPPPAAPLTPALPPVLPLSP